MTYYFQSGFFVAHVIVWAAAAALAFFLLHRVRALSEKADMLQRISEGEFRRYTYPVEKFEQYFDYCASVFIFIGLIGTMYGFIQAVPELQNSKYDFHHFRDALTVSAFGIVWSTVLIGLVSIHHLLFVSPIFEKLLQKQNLDQLANLLGQELNRFGTQITSTLSRGLSDFSLSANNVATAAARLAETADGAARSFTASSEALNRSAKTVDDIYQRTKKLPEAVADELKKTFEAHNQLLKGTFDAQLGYLKEGSESIRDAFHQSQTQWENARNTALKDARTRMAEFFEEMQRGYQKVLLDEHQKLSAGTAVAIGAVKEMLDDFERSMNDVEKRVPEGVQRAYSEAVTNILEASAKLSAAAIDSAKVAESLNRTTSDAQRGMAGLADVVRSLAGSVSRLDTSQVTSLDRKLDEILITVRDGTKIADLGGRPGDRRWWPWRSLTRRGED